MRGRRGRRGMSIQRSHSHVTFPCHAPDWGEVRSELEALLLVKDVNELVQKLNRIHHLSQGKEDTDARPVNVFKGLGVFLTKCEEQEQRSFLDVSFPTIIKRALEFEELLPPDGVPLLPRQQAGQVVLSRRFIASVVACGFLCVFPKLQLWMKDGFRSINFTNFYQHLPNEAQQAKLRCILHYFERLAENESLPAGNITFTRKVLESTEAHDLDWWQETDIQLCPLIVHHKGVIEEAPHPAIQVDFANRKIGGGVLATGKVQKSAALPPAFSLSFPSKQALSSPEPVYQQRGLDVPGQEEIRFATTPELLASMVIFEAMDENEAIWISGFETFSAHEGYGKTLKFVGDFRDKTPVNRHGNLGSVLCAMDALTGATQRQYQDIFILREVNKAFIGFLQKCNGGSEGVDQEDIDRFSETLSQEIITTAAHQAALVLTQSRMAEHPRLPCDRHVMRSDSSDTSSESHHSFSSGGEGDRSWNMNLRRRSSNLSDVGSRRSSDLASRRSSGSTRYSSDLSSDLEELYESFQRQESRQRPAAIKEELSAGAVSGIQDYVSSMVSNVVEESSNLAAQMMPGVQNFGGLQPSDVAKPRAFKPPINPQDMGIDFTVDLDSSSDSSNQTDDQKAKENIVRFVSQLVEKAFVGASGGDEEEPSSDQLSLHHSWSGSESSGSPHIQHYLEASPRLLHHDGSTVGAIGGAMPHYTDRGHRTSQPTIDPSSWISHPAEVSARAVYRQDSYNQRMSHLEGSPRPSSRVESSPRISQLDGSPRSEANAMWRHQEALLLSEFARMNGRRRSSTDFAGSETQRPQMIADPSSGGIGSRGFVHGESLTDDFKEAVANSASAFHAVQAAAAAAAAGAMPIRGEDEHIPFPYVPSVSDLPDIRNMPETRPAGSYRESRSNFHSKSETSLLNYRHSSHGNTYHRQDAFDSDLQPGNLWQDGATGYNPLRVSGSANALTVAGQIVQQSLDSAVRAATQQVQACGGATAWRNLSARRDSEQSSSSQPRHSHFGRSLSMSKPRRKGSMDESLSSFAHCLARHSSLGELSNSLQQRRGSSGFKDSTLSNFADELLDTSAGVPDSHLFDLRRHSVGGERSGLFRRGSAESRTSSLSRHSSTDVLFPACSTPDETPPWALNRGRRSSREVVLELLSSSALTDTSSHRRRPTSATSHLDWFAQDLLMEAFNDAFIELFGQDYLESIDYQRRQIRHRSRSCSRDKELFEFADSFVQNVLQEAIQVLTSEEKTIKRNQRAPSEEEEVGSNYEDALDVPFPMIESYASSLAGNIIDQARKDVVRRQQTGPHAIATGNWGCGAFRGNPQLKSLLQWAAASCAGAPSLHYYTFESPEVRQLPEVMETIRVRGWHVGHILQYVVQYARQHRYRDQSLPSLFDSLLQ